MSLAEKAGQVFMVSIYGRNLPEAGAALITDYHPGAVALFAYNTDYQPLAEVASLINQMQALSTADNGPPLFIALDHEGGRVRRLVNGVTRFPDPLGFGALPEPGPYQTIGRLTGAELRAVGVNMNLAPVLDLFSRPDLQDKNRVLYRRTLGDDPA
jgi:beta-N-acetylhexosaminidase